jgi:hypothetical protein
MRNISNIQGFESFVPINRVNVIKNCRIQNLDIIKHDNDTFGNENILFVNHKFLGNHGHFLKDILFQISYYFKLKKYHNNLILYIPLKTQISFINQFLDLLNIDNIQGANKEINCKNFYFLDNVYDTEHDVGNNGKVDFTDDIFFYRKHPESTIKNPKYCCDWKNIKYHVYDDIMDVVNIILNNIEANHELNKEKYKNDKVYFSRRCDPTHDTFCKFYYMKNINEISDIIKTKALEISPPSKLSILEKILYINNCNTFIMENSGALLYALFAKPDTNIIILTSELMYYGNSSIINAIKNKFKNVKIIKGYDNVLINKNFRDFQKTDIRENYLNNDESFLMGFYFNKEDNIKKIFNNKLKFFQKRNIHINNKNNEVNVYEFVNDNHINHPQINDKYYKYIAGNTINSRFQISKSNFNYIMNECKQNDIDVNGISLNFWSMQYYIIDANDILNLLSIPFT